MIGKRTAIFILLLKLFCWCQQPEFWVVLFFLKVQIRTTAKDILKNKMKDLKFQEKNLTFYILYLPTKTKTGRFLTDKISHQPVQKGNVCPSNSRESINRSSKLLSMVTGLVSCNILTLYSNSEI